MEEATISPVNQVAIAAKPRHPEDTVVGVLKLSDDHGLSRRFIVQGDGEFKAGGAGGSIKSRDSTVGWSCMLQQPQAAGVGFTQYVVGGTGINEK